MAVAALTPLAPLPSGGLQNPGPVYRKPRSPPASGLWCLTQNSCASPTGAEGSQVLSSCRGSRWDRHAVLDPAGLPAPISAHLGSPWGARLFVHFPREPGPLFPGPASCRSQAIPADPLGASFVAANAGGGVSCCSPPVWDQVVA